MEQKCTLCIYACVYVCVYIVVELGLDSPCFARCHFSSTAEKDDDGASYFVYLLTKLVAFTLAQVFSACVCSRLRAREMYRCCVS